MNRELIDKLLLSRKKIMAGLPIPVNKAEEEGGCGVVGLCCNKPVAARHIYEPSKQMHNRGNGKGGGIAAVGFIPEQIGVSQEVLNSYYMMHIAFLDIGVRRELENKYITPFFDVTASRQLETVRDWTSIPSLEAKPPDVWRYFVRVKPAILDSYIVRNELSGISNIEAEGEFITEQCYRLNQEFYASLGDKKAFVMSYGKNIMILKVVGYAETITEYYKINDLKAHVWIAHQRFPTKGRVWHPGGAHPFGALNTALVHNGDFANYHSVCEYLAQRHIYPQFLTDTEVSVQLFDLLDRVYHYPLEYIIESLAPTSELDFDRLPPDRQSIYRAIQTAHIHSSPDGPWFFIIARNLPETNQFQLLGITDTAMLRPQVFAFCDGEVQVGLIGSEKQAIDAALLSLSKEDLGISPIADRYWNARGGSHTDGGSFIFTLGKNERGKLGLTCTDKFGVSLKMPSGQDASTSSVLEVKLTGNSSIENGIRQSIAGGNSNLFKYVCDNVCQWSLADFRLACDIIVRLARDTAYTTMVIEVLTLLNDRRYVTGEKRRKYVLQIVRNALHELFDSLPRIADASSSSYGLIDFNTRGQLRGPRYSETTLVINTQGFPPEGDDCDAALIMDAYFLGWKRFICYNCIGQRFIGCGLGPQSNGVIIDVYDSSGDYLGSGIDGLTINVHGNTQDQLGQIIKSGKLVIHGDTGQTFMYGAKGGAVFVLGNAAGRPLINSVGRPRVVINGTCLDFLAESFMAGDVFNGGGFVIINGIAIDDEGRMTDLKEPYPGSNLFSLASGGAIYIRDPENRVVKQQLNSGQFFPLTDNDWEIMLPYLQENERLFGIKVDDLLTVNGVKHNPSDVYRKVAPVKLAALSSKNGESEE